MKKNNSHKKKRTGMFLCILILVVLLMALLWQGYKDDDRNRDETALDYKLDEHLCVTYLGSYSGPYMEDGSREEVADVLMVSLTNVGEKTLQYAEITLSSEEEKAVFKVSTLKPGETVRVLETERKTYDSKITYTEASVKNAVYFDEAVDLYEDILMIQPLDGGFNITNISEKDINGEIMIYYKDIREGVLMGGITFRGKIEGGLKAGEIKQIMSKNFSQDNTKVVFVTIREQ